MRAAKLIVVVSSTALACSSGYQGSDASPAQAGESTVVGVVRMVGNDPFAQPVVEVREGEDRRQIAVLGTWKEEIGRLSGAEIEVTGRMSANPSGMPADAITAEQYRVVAINGERAYVGVLTLRDGTMWLDGDTEMRLAVIPPGLRGKAGAKVWVTGQVGDGTIRVQSHGVIREP